MARSVTTWGPLAALVLGLVPSGESRAGGGSLPWLHRHHDCPPGSYSRLNYWAPSLYTYHAMHNPGPSPYACDRYPGLPLRIDVIPYRCPPLSPAAYPYPGLMP